MASASSLAASLNPATPADAVARAELREIDASAKWPVIVFLLSGLIWLLVGSGFALVSSIKLHTPEFLGDYEWLTFGRARTAHLNSVVYGWSMNVAFAVAFWLMARLSRAQLRHAGVLIMAACFWNLGVTIGIIGILAGDSTSIEWLEIPPYATPLLFVAYALISVWAVITFRFLELLPSSEGFMGFQVQGENDMRFTPWYGVFFEFVPFTHLDGQGGIPADAPSLTITEVRPGERYAVILSTCSGLWRYHIGDTIRFTSLAPLRFEFTGRDRFLDRFEEKVTQAEVDLAVAELNEQTDAGVVEFMVGPEIEQRRHLWVLAVKGNAPDKEQLAQFLDERLMSFNADYATFRRQGRIKPPHIVTVPEERIYHWSYQVRGKLGGQSKIPHIDPTVSGDLVRSLAEFSS